MVDAFKTNGIAKVAPYAASHLLGSSVEDSLYFGMRMTEAIDTHPTPMLCKNARRDAVVDLTASRRRNGTLGRKCKSYFG